MQILIAVASLSGNTREVARQIAAHCTRRGHTVDWIEVECAAHLQHLQPAALYLLGSWSDNAGRTPGDMKDFVALLRDRIGLPEPPRVAVFGTGETQWGLEYYCGAAHRLARFFHSPHPVLEIEQMPHGSDDRRTIQHWTDQLLTQIETLPDADPARHYA